MVFILFLVLMTGCTSQGKSGAKPPAEEPPLVEAPTNVEPKGPVAEYRFTASPAGNINNGGFAAAYEKWLFYGNPADSGTMTGSFTSTTSTT